jgi:hypothetical protein
MATDELIQLASRELAQGTPDEKIKKILVGRGVTHDDATGALAIAKFRETHSALATLSPSLRSSKPLRKSNLPLLFALLLIVIAGCLLYLVQTGIVPATTLMHPESLMRVLEKYGFALPS